MIIRELPHLSSAAVHEKTLCRDVERLFASVAGLPFPFLLESGTTPEQDTGGFTFLGADPFITFEASGQIVKVKRGGGIEEEICRDPFSALKALMSEFRESAHPVFPFVGGAVGYIGYESGEHIEAMPVRKHDTVYVPDIRFCLYDTVIAYNHRNGISYILSTGFPEEGKERDSRSLERADFFSELLSKETKLDEGDAYIGEVSSNFSRDDYIAAIGKIKEYIKKGDIYQANLSQRFEAPFDGSACTFYRRFTKINPVPFGAFLSYPDMTVVSNSPERLICLRNGIIETSPIKGTIRRAGGVDEAVSKESLKRSSKDGAEHLMIVDLERNDLGKVCRYGTVKVEEFKRIESYANLHHMVSVVTGKAREGVGPFDCIRAVFPGGSITGAPKIRAMEVIHEMEPNPRWIYTGSIGYIGFDGGMDMNIAIRTALIAGGKVYFSAGGGIVADSEPEAEYEESLLKEEIFRKIASSAYP